MNDNDRTEDVLERLDRAREAALEEDWQAARQLTEAALEVLDGDGESDAADESSPNSFLRLVGLRRVNWFIVFGVAGMVIGAVLWFQAQSTLEDISDELRVVYTFTDSDSIMPTILDLEDERSQREILRAVGIGAIIAGALVTIYGFPRRGR